jgi:hypothetical protein
MEELIKCGGKGIIEAIHKLISMIWTTEEMPQTGTQESYAPF